jgi:hypothetical protein
MKVRISLKIGVFGGFEGFLLVFFFKNGENKGFLGVF